MKVNNSEILDFCLYTPYLAFSELSKYFINESRYVRDKKIEYQANGNLVIEENNKETVKSAVKIPGDQVYFPFVSKTTEEE